MLTAEERVRLDAARLEGFDACHRENVEDVLRDLRHQRAQLVIVSTGYCQRVGDAARIARVVREFPQVPTVALISQSDRGTARAVLTLGQCGIRTLVDLRDPAGWAELRNLLYAEHSVSLRQRAVTLVGMDLAGMPQGARNFFEVLFAVAPRTGTIRSLADGMQVMPSTLMSRFFRANLPPPRKYLSYARLVFAARLLENPGLSVSLVSLRMGYSSAQSFGRHVRILLGLRASEFRSRYDADGMLQRFREELVLQHRDSWLAFDPLVTVRGGRRVARRLRKESEAGS
jgi:AraC-like DNA-binding protein